ALDAEPTRIAFADASFAERIGWREIVAVGSGATLAVSDGELRATSISQRLTAYPEELIAAPLADVSLTVDAVAGGPGLPPVTVVDAIAIDGAAPSPSPGVGAVASGGPTPTSAPAGGVVPGGVSGGDLPSIFRTADVTPLVLLLSVVTAAALGAGHALTPGHGKTLMAAYLVGTRGTPVHALGLGLSVSLSHTVGILVLAAVILGAADLLPPELVVRMAPVIAAVSIVAIGGWMLIGELRRRRAAHVATLDHHHGGEPAHDHDHDGAQAHDHPHGPDHRPDAAGMHSHGGVTHSHLPPAGTAISWRSLFVLGLAGGLIPSTSALLILLGAIAAGRPGFGFVLVVAFGLGMAGVMAGIGLLIVAARGRLDRLPSGGGLGRARDLVPLVAAVLVFGFGLYLTAQAIAGAPTL
ncbi:MAG TPA: hypothetical protein VD763_05115, partial [Candidatus Saccharimonadales bacterium]|nr:hypothetical protein [Candidatus Saccharimonadales bacterium]